MSSHPYVEIDSDTKTFYIKGSGTGFSRAWGGKKNHVFTELESFENSEFEVNKTQMIGKNLWYYGKLDGKKTWIHDSDLKELER
ncbi:GW dipeptide domain-containing protein [Virgibacillus necropolis]